MSGVSCKKAEEIKKPVSSRGLHSNVAERFISFYKSGSIKHSAAFILSNRTLKLSIGTILPISAKVSRNGACRKSFCFSFPDNFMASEWCGESVFLFTFVTLDKSKSHAARAVK